MKHKKTKGEYEYNLELQINGYIHTVKSDDLYTALTELKREIERYHGLANLVVQRKDGETLWFLHPASGETAEVRADQLQSHKALIFCEKDFFEFKIKGE